MIRATVSVPMETQRIFFALPLPPEVREQLASLRDRAVAELGGTILRPVKTENFHITLHFLGEQPRTAIESAREVLRGISDSPLPAPRIEIGDLGAFPKPGAARVLWADARDAGKGAERVHATLGTALAERSFLLDDRPFRSHITLCYVRKGVGRPALKRIQQWLERAKGAATGEPTLWTIPRVVLYRSVTGAGGSEYTELDHADLLE